MIDDDCDMGLKHGEMCIFHLIEMGLAVVKSSMDATTGNDDQVWRCSNVSCSMMLT
jgi:hypothetical protein